MTEDPRRRWLAVERIVATPSGKSKPALSEEEVKQHLMVAAEYLVRSGALEHIVELSALLAMIHDVVTDRMIYELTRNVIRPLGLLIDGLSRTSLIEVVSQALADPDLEKALLEVKEGKKVSTTTLISLMNDAEVKQGLYIMLKLLKALGKSVKRLD
jgi:uncharacterized protein YjgD (DUF1641 family)